MSKKAIHSIIFFMSVSLLGLIGFQAYWISHSVKQEARNFDRNMQQLLNDVSNEVTKQQAKFLVTSASSFKKYEQPRKPIIIKGDIVDDIQVVVKEAQNVQISPGDSSGKTIVINTDDGSKTTITTFHSSSNTVTSVKSEGLVAKYIKQKNILTEVVDEMAYEFAFDNVQLGEQLKGTSLDSIFIKRLNSEGFQNISYAFKVKDFSSGKTIKSGGLLSEKKNNAYYTADLLEKGEIELSVNNKTLLVLKSLWLSLALSLVLTLLLISTFIYTINSILKQKRISVMKADFINNMTHEFKTPIATISLAVDSILHKEVKENPTEIEKFGSIIKKENQRMNQQVESLLGIALFDKESFQLKQESVDVHELILELKENFEIKINSQSGDIALSLGAEFSQVKADRMHFYNVLRNIVENGIKFSPQKIRIKISTYTKREKIVICISDQGIGMSKETLNKIFDRFYRKTEGDLHTTKGFGLGLSYVKEVVSKMGGEISVESTPDKGSKFTLKLDLIK